MTFHRSSFCSVGTCVEVARDVDGSTVVRDSKLSKGVLLRFTADEWADFVAGVKAGEFDFPTP
ncbi:DUF397 domain-containing protein [Pseudonocardia sp. WMMC193]|nr:DUF397 domain-containing protein [Pseudonocardia sp. WMMC193]